MDAISDKHPVIGERDRGTIICPRPNGEARDKSVAIEEALVVYGAWAGKEVAERGIKLVVYSILIWTIIIAPNR